MEVPPNVASHEKEIKKRTNKDNISQTIISTSLRTFLSSSLFSPLPFPLVHRLNLLEALQMQSQDTRKAAHSQRLSHLTVAHWLVGTTAAVAYLALVGHLWTVTVVCIAIGIAFSLRLRVGAAARE